MSKPIIIAHRGASGYRPEHSLASYQLAIEQGCDFIEPDLVITKDKQLICRHENNIAGTTNVADFAQFANRFKTKIIDGEKTEGWFTEDFTLAEIKMLRAKERLPQLRAQNTKFDGQFEIPTFEEVLELRAKASNITGREIGIYPETKHPSYFASLGLFYDDEMLSLIRKYGLDSEKAPIFIQSFETLNLIALKTKTKVRLIQLMSEDFGPFDSQDGFKITYKEMLEPQNIGKIAQYAYGIGPEKTLILPRDINGNSLAPTKLVENAHKVGLKLHPWTFRLENAFLPKELHGDNIHGKLQEEIKIFAKLGVDGIFCDFPDIANAALN